MRKQLFWVMVALGLIPGKSGAALHYSYGDTLYGPIDFSTGAIGFRIVPDEELDLRLYASSSGPEVGVEAVLVVAPAGSVDMGAVPLEGVSEAPDPSEVNYLPATREGQPVVPLLAEGHTYVVRTREGHFAKFYVVLFELVGNVPVIIDWVYQDDGSRNLDHITLVQPEAWGEIKEKRGLNSKGGG